MAHDRGRGGPADQIAIPPQELVEKRRWVRNGRFQHALNYCTSLPGPEAQQLAIFAGWLPHRTLGGLVAGVLFVLPAFYWLRRLSGFYVSCGGMSPRWRPCSIAGVRR